MTAPSAAVAAAAAAAAAMATPTPIAAKPAPEAAAEPVQAPVFPLAAVERESASVAVAPAPVMKAKATATTVAKAPSPASAPVPTTVPAAAPVPFKATPSERDHEPDRPPPGWSALDLADALSPPKKGATFPPAPAQKVEAKSTPAPAPRQREDVLAPPSVKPLAPIVTLPQTPTPAPAPAAKKVVMVSSPAAEPAPAPPATKVSPKAEVSAPTPVPPSQPLEIQPSLLESPFATHEESKQAPASSAPTPVAAAGLQTGRIPAHELLDSILRRKEGAESAAKAGTPSQPEPGPEPAALPESELATVSPTAPAPNSTVGLSLDDTLTPHVEVGVAGPASPFKSKPAPTALVPEHVTDVDEVEKAEMPGMGEVLAGKSAVPAAVGSSEARPLLHVPFVPVRTTAGEERRAKMHHFAIVGIVCFVLLDLLGIFIWKDEIGAWLGRGKGAKTDQEQSATFDPGISPGEASAGATPSTTAESPAPGSPRPGPQLSLATTSDFPADKPVPAPESETGAAAPVPMAIPLPGHTQKDVPTATPLPATADKAAATPSIAETKPATGPKEPTTPLASMPAPPLTLPIDELPTKGTPPSSPKADAAASSLPLPTPPAPLSAAPGQDSRPSAPTTPAESTTASSPTAAANSPAMPAPAPTSVPVTEPPAIPTTPPAEAPPLTMPEPLNGAPTAPAPTGQTPVASLPRRVGKVPSEARPALEALGKFLDSASWKERLNYVQRPDSVRERMESHAAEKGDGPIRVGAIDFVERYPSKGGVPPYCMFEVSGGSLPHPVLTLVEQDTKNGNRVDWEAFMEFRDDRLLHFLEKKGAPPQNFRGLLRRKHYFDRDVPDIASKDSFELEQPNARFEGHVFVPRNSALGKQLANQLPWGQDMPVIVQLVWKSDAKAWWVQIEKIVSYGWRGE